MNVWRQYMHRTLIPVVLFVFTVLHNEHRQHPIGHKGVQGMLPALLWTPVCVDYDVHGASS